jgi:hypothetical protein
MVTIVKGHKHRHSERVEIELAHALLPKWSSKTKERLEAP